MKIYCCLEHTELALDVMVDEIELAPVFEKIENSTDKKSCEYCDNEAVYVVGNQYSYTKCGYSMWICG